MRYTRSLIEKHNPGEFYRAQWDQYKSALQSLRDTADRMQAVERAAFGISEDYGTCAHDAFSQFDGDERLLKMGKSIISTLVGMAAERFAPEDAGPIDIKDSEYIERYLDRRSVEEFDPKKVWDALVKKLDKGRGERLAHQQVIEALLYAFGIKKGTPLKQVKGWTVLEHSVYIEKDFNQHRYLSYYCGDTLRKAVLSLASFLRWAGEPQAADDCEAFGSLFIHHRDVNSRESFRFGNVAEVITYHTRFEYRISSPIMVKLQEYMHLYRHQDDAQQAA